MTSQCEAAKFRFVVASVTGQNHLRVGQQNQDRQMVKVLGNGIHVAAVADGAGSRSRSDLGAQIAVDTAISVADTHFEADIPETRSGWMSAVATYGRACAGSFDERLAEEIVLLKEESNELDSEEDFRNSFATTLLAVVALPPWYGYISVGDCFFVVNREPGGAHLIWPSDEAREHAGSTVFMTSHGRDRNLATGIVEDPYIKGFALCSDGLYEGMLVTRQTATGGLRFAAPTDFSRYFDFFADDRIGQHELEQKLASSDFAATSGDDKTMVMAVRGG